MALLNLVVSLSAMACVHLLYLVRQRRFASLPHQDRPRQAVSKRTRQFNGMAYVLGAGMVAQVLLQTFVRTPQGPSVIRLALSIAVEIAGLALLHWALQTLGAQFSPCHEARVPTERVQSGPYRWVSHPIYLANILVQMGVTIANPGPLAFAVILGTAYFYAWAIRDENRMLDERFPAA